MAASSKNRRATSANIEKSISTIAGNFNFAYLLRRYLDKGRWVEEIKSCFGVACVDNLTDFNYSNCFSYAINEGGRDLRVGTPDLVEYVIRNGELHRAQLMISVLAPYVTYRYLRYANTDGNLSLESVCVPPAGFGKGFEEGVAALCEKNSLHLIDDEDLKRSIEGISMELAGPDPSVFNLFFEDGSSKFPY